MKVSKLSINLLFLSLLFLGIACSKKNDCPNCEMEPVTGDCNAAFPKYYFDSDEGKCKVFTWGGCGGVIPFETLEECQECECKN